MVDDWVYLRDGLIVALPNFLSEADIDGFADHCLIFAGVRPSPPIHRSGCGGPGRQSIESRPDDESR
jgi:hypothetical protein